MILSFDTVKKLLTVFAVSLAILILIHVLIAAINVDLSEFFHRQIDSTSFSIEFAPEIWFTLMSIVLGTLIIVISIASQSNPKLIDYYIGDYPSLYYTCAISLAGIENVFMQLNLSVNSLFWNNVIFVNAYLLLPLAIFNAIPYAFYILSYTKTSSLIRTIFLTNKKIISSFLNKKKINKLEKVHFHILDTINQLDDQHGFVNFKEPKSEITKYLSELLQFYLQNKPNINPAFFQVTDTVKSDISFRTLSDKFIQIEESQTFFEYKVLRIYAGIYNQLIEEGHHDLASQCADELCRIGIVAAKTNNKIVLELVLVQFNTFLRFGIKYANQARDIRNVYNCVFHYTQLILFLVKAGEEKFIIRACEYLTYYGREIYKLSFTENHFIFLIDSFASEIQRVLIAIHRAGFTKEFQLKILKIYATIEPEIEKDTQLERVRNNTARGIKISLILFYINKQEDVFIRQLIEDIIDDLHYFKRAEVFAMIKKDCSSLMASRSSFWEYTDRGDQNIYFTPYKDHIKEFYKLFTNQFIRQSILKEPQLQPEQIVVT